VRTTEELTDLFRSSGRKVTPQRQRIFRALQGNEQHPSAEMVHGSVLADMPTVSLKTVYQTLHELAELGEISALDLGTGMVRFDPNVETPHHHLVCRSCGKVRDVFVAIDGLRVDPDDALGYEVASAEVVFRGLCDECRHLSTTPTNQEEKCPH
jgi:Fe2+ or Zn2+ uptake regulation protein